MKIFKDGVLKDLKESNCPLVLWCYCLQRCSEINNATAADNLSLEGTNPHMKMTGQRCDISNLYVNLVGMIGFTSVMRRHHFPIQRRC